MKLRTCGENLWTVQSLIRSCSREGEQNRAPENDQLCTPHRVIEIVLEMVIEIVFLRKLIELCTPHLVIEVVLEMVIEIVDRDSYYYLRMSY